MDALRQHLGNDAVNRVLTSNPQASSILPTVPAFASTSGSDNASRMSFNSDLSENDIREFPLSAPWKEDE